MARRGLLPSAKLQHGQGQSTKLSVPPACDRLILLMQHPYYSTRILRPHIRSHRKVVGSFGRGYVTQADRDDTIAWYESLFGDNGDEARGVNPENENQSKDAEERGADDEAEDQTESMVQEIKREIMKEITQEIQEEIQEEIKQEMKRETKEKMKREMKEQMKREMKEKMKREMKQKMKREIEKEMME